MKFTISMPAIKTAAKLSAPFAASSNDLAELRCMKIHAADGMLTFTAFNRTAWVHLLVAGAEIHRPGVCLVDAETLRRWVSAGGDAYPLDFEIKGTELSLKSGAAKCNLETLDVAKFADPTAPQDSGHTDATLPASDLMRGLASASFAADKKDFQQIRTDVVYFDMDAAGLHLVSSDGKVLSEVALAARIVGPDNSQSVPRSSVQLLNPLLESVAGADVDILLGRHDCLVKSERFEFGTRLIDTRQFPWRKLMVMCEATKGPRVNVPVKDLGSAIRQVLAADPTEFRLRLDFKAGGVEVGISKKAATFIEIPGNETEISFCCQPETITDLLNAVSRHNLPLTVEWGVHEPTCRIALFRAGTDWRYTVTPLIDAPQEAK